METASKFSFTLDGFLEAKEYLKQYGWLDRVQNGRYKGFELIEEANRLYTLILKA